MAEPLTPAEVFPPGDFLRDELDARSWSIAEFAQIVGLPARTIAAIIDGRESITSATAAPIARALGTSALLWLNLQAHSTPGRFDADPVAREGARDRE